MQDNNKLNIQKLLEFIKEIKRLEQRSISPVFDDITQTAIQTRIAVYSMLIPELEGILSQWQ